MVTRVFLDVIAFFDWPPAKTHNPGEEPPEITRVTLSGHPIPLEWLDDYHKIKLHDAVCYEINMREEAAKDRDTNERILREKERQ